MCVRSLSLLRRISLEVYCSGDEAWLNLTLSTELHQWKIGGTKHGTDWESSIACRFRVQASNWLLFILWFYWKIFIPVTKSIYSDKNASETGEYIIGFSETVRFLQQFPTYTTRGNGRTSLLVSYPFGLLPYYSQLEFQKSYQTPTIW